MVKAIDSQPHDCKFNPQIGLTMDDSKNNCENNHALPFWLYNITIYVNILIFVTISDSARGLIKINNLTEWMVWYWSIANGSSHADHPKDDDLITLMRSYRWGKPKSRSTSAQTDSANNAVHVQPWILPSKVTQQAIQFNHINEKSITLVPSSDLLQYKKEVDGLKRKKWLWFQLRKVSWKRAVW